VDVVVMWVTELLWWIAGLNALRLSGATSLHGVGFALLFLSFLFS
jgi:hypothetical protein